MSLTLSPTKIGFLDRVRSALVDLPAEDLEEVTQDLEAQIAELSDADVETVLGTPQDFVAEFRAIAGLDHKTTSRIARARARVREWETMITRSEGWTRVTRFWSPVRPAWIWLRGWLGVSLFSVFTLGSDAFRAVPLPTVGDSALLGLIVVAAATWLSVVLARQRAGTFAGFLSATFTALIALLLMVSLANPTSHAPAETFEAFAPGLVSEGGEPVRNIYAFDVDGNPVEVLLYDQDGRPLLNLPSYTYEQVEYLPQQDRFPTDYGEVQFQRDDLGRIIPNLYPLVTWEYSQYGELAESQPPRLGFPKSSTPSGANSDEEGVATTIAVIDVD